MYKKIMVPLDGSELAECVLPHVDGFVTGCQVETIIFVRVIESTPTSYSGISSTTKPQDFEKIQENAKKIEEERKSSVARYLAAVISRVKQEGIKYKAEVLVGKVADRLVDYVDANEIDLVLIATHGRSGISRWVRGSIADRVLRSSRAPVLMVRADGKMSGGKV
jgi:nucleotide-binding universal stress UspA family protein